MKMYSHYVAPIYLIASMYIHDVASLYFVITNITHSKYFLKILRKKECYTKNTHNTNITEQNTLWLHKTH